MINNQYIRDNIELDTEMIEFLVSHSKKILSQEWIDAPAPMSLQYTDENDLKVSDYSILKEFRDKHPNLISVIKLYKIEPGLCAAHIDNHRQCTLNIPVYNCNTGTLTRFYKNYSTVKEKWLESFGSHGPATWYSDDYITYIDGGELAYQFSLTSPTIMNTRVPHDIYNTTNTYRLMWSWSFDCSFEDAVKDFAEEGNII